MEHKQRTSFTIDEGYALDYLIPAFFVGIIGPAVLLIDHLNNGIFELHFGTTGIVMKYFLFCCALATSALLIAVKSGIEIDTGQNRIRVFKSIFGQKIGSWTSLDNLKKAQLGLTSESQIMRSRGTDKAYQTKTYDLILVFDNKSDLEFHNFSDYKLAKRTLDKLREITGVETEDNTRMKSRSARV